MGSDFVLADLSYIYASPLGSEKVLKVAHAVGGDGNSIVAFPFGSRTKLVTTK